MQGNGDPVDRLIPRRAEAVVNSIWHGGCTLLARPPLLWAIISRSQQTNFYAGSLPDIG